MDGLSFAKRGPFILSGSRPGTEKSAICRLTGSEKLAAAGTATMAESSVRDLQPLTNERSLLAAEIARKTALRGADAVYPQLAAERADRLVTLNKQQLQRRSAVARVEATLNRGNRLALTKTTRPGEKKTR